MKCPKCGKEFPDNSLYCTHCGEEINIVPVFEPEVNQSVEETMQQIVKEMDNSKTAPIPPLKILPQKNKQKSVLPVLMIFTLCLAALATGCYFLLSWFNRQNSPEYYEKLALQSQSSGDYLKAVEQYEKAIALKGEDIFLELALADCYEQCGNETEYENCLLRALQSPAADNALTESIYNRLFRFYLSRNDLGTIDKMLNDCNNETVKSSFQYIYAKEPVFSLESGVYNDIIMVSLNGDGTIFYTIDGTDPKANGIIYSDPITVEQDGTVIKAYCRNQYGFESECVTHQYYIRIPTVLNPTIRTAGGSYSHAELIRVNVPEDCKVYYTTDNSAPTKHSKVYKGAFPMPLGDSDYQFVAINGEGNSGDVHKVHYSFQLTGALDLNMALATLQKALSDNNLLMTVTSEGEYTYQFQYVLGDGTEDYYIYQEVLKDNEGVSKPTGIIYGIHARNATCYKFHVTEDYNYQIVENL